MMVVILLVCAAQLQVPFERYGRESENYMVVSGWDKKEPGFKFIRDEKDYRDVCRIINSNPQMILHDFIPHNNNAVKLYIFAGYSDNGAKRVGDIHIDGTEIRVEIVSEMSKETRLSPWAVIYWPRKDDKQYTVKIRSK